jgi:hypothetical protein
LQSIQRGSWLFVWAKITRRNSIGRSLLTGIFTGKIYFTPGTILSNGEGYICLHYAEEKKYRKQLIDFQLNENT